MRTTFQEIERGHELYYALHQELIFKTFAKRNLFFAQWVAGLMGRRGKDKESYVRELLDYAFGDMTSNRLVGKAYEDLKRFGLHLPVERLKSKLYELEGAACRAMMDAIEAVPAVPASKRSQVKNTVVKVKDHAASGIQAIEDALGRVKEDLNTPHKVKFSDLFLAQG